MSRAQESTADRIFRFVCLVSVALPLVFGAWFVLDTLVRAAQSLSSLYVRVELFSALLESARMVGAALAVSLPLGFGAAIYLEYLASRRFFPTLAQRAVSSLAAVPSVLYGLFGLTLFMVLLDVHSIFTTGALTLGLFLFPIVVQRTRDALQTVPPLVHEASLALGADPWRAFVHVVLPLALPKLAAEVLLVIARALGTVAPLLVVERFVDDPPTWRIKPLATRIFDSITHRDPAEQTLAAPAIITLLALIVILHVVAHRLAGRKSLSGRGML